MRNREAQESKFSAIPAKGARFLVVYKCNSSGENQYIEILAHSAKKAVDTLRVYNPTVNMGNCTIFPNCSPMNGDRADGPLVEWKIETSKGYSWNVQQKLIRRRVRQNDKILKEKTTKLKRERLERSLSEERATQKMLDNRKG